MRREFDLQPGWFFPFFYLFAGEQVFSSLWKKEVKNFSSSKNYFNKGE
jgi:hypothetical protein